MLQISKTKSFFYPELSAEIIVGQSQGGNQICSLTQKPSVGRFKSHNVLENSQDTEILFSLILTLPAEDLLVTDSLTSA